MPHALLAAAIERPVSQASGIWRFHVWLGSNLVPAWFLPGSVLTGRLMLQCASVRCEQSGEVGRGSASFP
ncbi:hypothetical protein NDU88_005954 [Pleurodeles waltl]|uniref:Uncharacterized protein n=1 Tax=Pleurodeles waltl TaxID=8319 RepID=A0AAV7RKN0_PLEWA|nr:hypothetical protein NDU88_005954 [Pleurodeles waltl]